MLPLFPLNTVVFPDEELELELDDPRDIKLIKDAQKTKGQFVVVYCAEDDDGVENLSPVGCLVKVVKDSVYEDGVHRVLIAGIKPFAIAKVEKGENYFSAKPGKFEDQTDLDPDSALLTNIETMVDTYRDLVASVDADMLKEEMQMPPQVSDSYLVIDQMILDEEKRQEVLEISSVKGRFIKALELLRLETERLKFWLEEPDEDDVAAIN